MIEEIKRIIIRDKKILLITSFIVGVIFLIPSIRRFTLLEEISFSAIFSNEKTQNGFFYILFVVIFWLWNIIVLIKAYRGSFLWKLRDDVLKSGYSSASIDTDFETADACYSFRFGKLMFYFTDENGKYPRAYSLKRILWGYYGRRKVGYTGRNIVLYVEGRLHPVELSIPSEEKAAEYLTLIASRCPWAVINYSKDLDDLYTNHRNEFKALKYNSEITKAQI